MMTIDEIIQFGDSAVLKCKKRGAYTGEFISGEEYAQWLALASRYLDMNFPGDKDTKEFREIAASANDSDVSIYYKLKSILKAFISFPPVAAKDDMMQIVRVVCSNFMRFDTSIRRRYANKSTISIEDEHDLQDALGAILKLFISDIRPEDYVPSYAGGRSRVDFWLPEQSLIIETKMTNESLQDKDIGEQLIIDFSRYKNMKKCSHLLCFVYDKSSFISNPAGLISDLEKLSDTDMQMTVIISP